MQYEEITRDEIESCTTLRGLLEDLGCTHILDKGHYFLARSPFHEDKHPSFALYKDSLVWKDWSNTLSGGGIDSLVWHTKGVHAREYLGLDSRKYLDKLMRKTEPERKLVAREEYDPENFEVVVEGNPIDFDLTHSRTFYKYAHEHRHMDDEFIDFFHVGFTRASLVYIKDKTAPQNKLVKTVYTDRLCLPIYENKRLVSIEGRDVSGTQMAKCIYPASCGGVGGSSYRSLFNIDNLKKDEPLVICEGTMDIPRIWSHITKNVTCTYGSSLKWRHSIEIPQFKDIIVFSDSDEGGVKMIEAIDRLIPDREIRVAQLDTPGEDPGSAKSVDDLRKAIDNSVTASEFLLRYNGYIS